MEKTQKELTPFQKAVKKAVGPLAKALNASSLVKNAIIDDNDGRFLIVEHNNGTVFSVYPRFFGRSVFNGYSLSQPIEPNTRTGSSVSIVGNDEHFDEGYSLEQVMETIEAGNLFVPYFFGDKDREATKHQTWRAVRLSPFYRDYHQIKGESPSDRDMVNSCIKQDRSYKNTYHQPVSLEFVEEMRDCVPPAFMGIKGPFYYIQVGEATDHAKTTEGEWVEVYETYVTATEQNDFTEKYDGGQWYFVGCKPQIANN